MNQEIHEVIEIVGCEGYLYRECKSLTCCLHPCEITACPEPICALDFPGGIRSYQKYKELIAVLLMGRDILQAAEELGMSRDSAQRLYKKGNRISQKCQLSLISQ
jgi:hypothetical protein